jgi:FkbM family methyltransferase
MRKHAASTYAFEPVPELARRLVARMGNRIAVRRVALSDASGSATLTIPVQGAVRLSGLSSLSGSVRRAHSQFETIVVQTLRLDDICIEPVGFMKIDVEGHEEAVLRGSRRTLQHSRPRVLVEIEERHAPGAVARIGAFFRELEYSGFFVHRTEMRPLDQFDPNVLQRPEVIAAYALGDDRKRYCDYVNNFIFVPDEEAAELVKELQKVLSRRSRWLRARQGDAHQIASEATRPPQRTLRAKTS